MLEPDTNGHAFQGNDVKGNLESSVPKMSLSTFYGNFMVAVRYVVAENIKDKKGFFIGFFTVFIVVFAISLLQTVIQNAPIIFIKLAEDTEGEFDILFTPDIASGKLSSPSSFLLNYTEMSQSLESASTIVGCTPRWVLFVKLRNPLTDKEVSCLLLAIDSKKEREIGLGRDWQHPDLVGDQTHVSEALLKQLGVQAQSNAKVDIELDILDLLHTVSGDAAPVDVWLRKTIYNYLKNPAYYNSQFNIPDSPAYQRYLQLLGFINPDTLNLTPGAIGRARRALTFRQSVTVVDSIDSPSGKFPKALGTVAIVDSAWLNTYLKYVSKSAVQQVKDSAIGQIGALPPNVTRALDMVDSFADTFNINEYALMVVAMIKDRMSTYYKDNTGKRIDFIRISNDVFKALGVFYRVTITTPLSDALFLIYFFEVTLDQVLLMVEIFLICVGMYLIYSLLLQNVEDKVYESGMLRALGMEQTTLIILLGIQSFIFSVPGVCVGLGIGWIAFIPIRFYLDDFAAFTIPLALTHKAIIMAVIVGFIMPMVALIYPIKRALSNTLRSSLDLYHSAANDSIVIITKLENLGISPIWTAISSLMVLFGFTVYFLVPWSFVFQNLALFFNIFVGILLGMLLGLSLVAMAFHKHVQRVVIWLLMWGADAKRLSRLVIRNSQGHSGRNTKTAVLFTTCVCFIIFSGSIFLLNEASLVDNIKVGLGSDVLALTFYEEQPLDEEGITKFLTEEKSNPNTAIRDFAFISHYLSDLPWVQRTTLGNLAAFNDRKVHIFGVQENILSATYDEYLVIQETDSHYNYDKTPAGKKDIVKSICTENHDDEKILSASPPEGVTIGPNSKAVGFGHAYNVSETYKRYLDIIVPESMRLPMSVDVNTLMEIQIRIDTHASGPSHSTTHHLAKARAFVSKMPGFFFSSYQQTSYLRQPVLVSMKEFERLMYQTWDIAYGTSGKGGLRPTSVPKRAVHIRFKKKATATDVSDIEEKLRNFITSDKTIVQNTPKAIRGSDTATTILNIFFNCVALVVFILCFFVLLVSFTANVNENMWEFGVLRAVGVDISQIMRVYIYEALSVVLSSAFLGYILGQTVSITLTLQGNLFTEMPFRFEFPTLSFCLIFGMSIGIAILGSYFPARNLKKKRIANALKNK